MRWLQSPKGLSPTGSAAQLVVPLLPLIAAAAYAGARWPDRVLFPARPHPVLELMGWLWLGCGVLFWAATLLQFLPRWRRGELICSGPYAWCRHPLYALLPCFVLPAVALIAQSWAYLAVAVCAYPLARRAGAREEVELARLFGEPWQAYAARTPAILPLPAALRVWHPHLSRRVSAR